MAPLRHGYTLADLHGLARLAVHTAGTMASNWHDRYDTAWSAIAEHLYAAEHWPPRTIWSAPASSPSTPRR
jgi:hypothetical protein